MSLFENFDLDIILLIEAFCLTWLTRIQLICICNPITSVYLLDMFDKHQTHCFPLTLLSFHVFMTVYLFHMSDMK